jgi:hypothetical protein
LSCSATAGLTCAFSPSTITPGGTTSTLTVSAAATPPISGYGVLHSLGVLLPGLGLFGTVLTTRKRKPLTRKSILSVRMLGLLLFVSLCSIVAVGCGGGSSNSSTQPSTSQATLTVTGTSGSITQSAALTINVD